VTVLWNREPPLHLRGVPVGSVRTLTLHGSATLVVHCLDPRGRPMPGSIVSVRLPSDPPERKCLSALTDEEGRVGFGPLPACDVVVHAGGDFAPERLTKPPGREGKMPRPVDDIGEPMPPSSLVDQDVTGLSLLPGATTTRDVHF